MPAVPAAQVGHRLAGLDLRQLERGVHVLLREAPGGYPSSRFQEDAIGLAHARRSAPAGGSTHSSAQRSSPRTTRPRASPLRVRRYSTPTGGPERTRRSTTPASSSSLRRSDTMRSLTTCKRSVSSLKRDGPSSSRTYSTRVVQRLPRRSTAAWNRGHRSVLYRRAR